ncbi:hypothetical protein FORC54_3966 [Vibrio vulnificus]|nr:hypothetical protein FORC54_3966 [Vibrio vulnificus]
MLMSISQTEAKAVCEIKPISLAIIQILSDKHQISFRAQNKYRQLMIKMINYAKFW